MAQNIINYQRLIYTSITNFQKKITVYDLAYLWQGVYIGCDVDACINHWSCFQGYLKYLGMAQTATVKRDARMGEAEARMEAGIRVGNNSSKERNCFYVDRSPPPPKKKPMTLNHLLFVTTLFHDILPMDWFAMTNVQCWRLSLVNTSVVITIIYKRNCSQIFTETRLSGTLWVPGISRKPIKVGLQHTIMIYERKL